MQGGQKWTKLPTTNNNVSVQANITLEPIFTQHNPRTTQIETEFYAQYSHTTNPRTTQVEQMKQLKPNRNHNRVRIWTAYRGLEGPIADEEQALPGDVDRRRFPLRSSSATKPPPFNLQLPKSKLWRRRNELDLESTSRRPDERTRGDIPRLQKRRLKCGEEREDARKGSKHRRRVFSAPGYGVRWPREQ
jgi:hypothetical protein